MTLTALVVTTAVIALGIYDLWAVTFGGVGSSISRLMQRSALRHPFIAFTIGYICGHIFGYMAPEPAQPQQVVEQQESK